MNKKILLLAALLLVCWIGQLLLGPARAEPSDTAPASPTTSKTEKPALTAPSFKVENDREDLFQDLLHQLIFMVIFIAVAGAAVWWAAKFYRGRRLTGSGRQVRVVETIPLGPRKTLHVIEAGSRKLLIGNTSDRITFLSDVTEALAAQPFSIPGLEEEDAQ